MHIIIPIVMMSVNIIFSNDSVYDSYEIPEFESKKENNLF